MIQILGIGVTAQDSLLPKRNVFFSKRLRKRGEGPIVFCIARGQRMKLFYGEAWVFAFFFPFFAREFIFPFFLLGEMDDYAFGPRRSLKRVGYFFLYGNLCQKGCFSVLLQGVPSDSLQPHIRPPRNRQQKSEASSNTFFPSELQQALRSTEPVKRRGGGELERRRIKTRILRRRRDSLATLRKSPLSLTVVAF